MKAAEHAIKKSEALDAIVAEWNENNNNGSNSLPSESNELKKMANKVNLIKCLSDDLLDRLGQLDCSY